MKNNIKRILNLLLVAVLMMSVTPTAVLIAEGESSNNTSTTETITWDGSIISGINIETYGSSQSFQDQEGISAIFTSPPGHNANWKNNAILTTRYDCTITFSSAKYCFTKIEIYDGGNGNIPLGWSRNGSEHRIVWNGNTPVNSVSLSTDGSLYIPTESVVFTVVPVSVSLSPNTTQTINLGDVVKFEASVSPSNAADKKVKWSVKDECVKLYTDSTCQTEVGTDAIETLTVYAQGWQTSSNNAITVTSNADSSKSASCNVVVTNEFTVTFDPANGNNTFTQSVANQGHAIRPATDQNNGDWTFGGWYLAPVDISKNPFVFESTAIISKMTLEAIWNGTFDFESNDSEMGKVGYAKEMNDLPNANLVSSGSINITKTYDDTYCFIAQPTSSNFIFDKWIDASGNTINNNNPANILYNYKCVAGEKAVAVFVNDLYETSDEEKTWTKGSTDQLSFAFKLRSENINSDNFDSLEIDGKPVEKTTGGTTNYTVGDGSVIIDLQPAYLETLSVGKHNLKITVKVDGFESTPVSKETSVQFIINKNNSDTNSSSTSTPRYRFPKTGIE